ncbi:MAG TPA: hypothetical protein VHM24_14125, partial [Gemmatimonadaceae bacterium]|nr:hypothetical protein [Gemmatimonadaceae bacterium]
VSTRSAIAFNQGDRRKASAIISDALRRGIVDPDILIAQAFDMLDAGNRDSANAVMGRALRVNPRYSETLIAAADLGSAQKDWVAVERHSRALIAIDPTDERAWAKLAQMGRNRGDSVAMHAVLEEAFRQIRSPTNLLLVHMVYAGHGMGARFVRMTPEQLGIETLRDSIGTYYDNKADWYLGTGDLGKARIYYDSIIAKLERRKLSGPGVPPIKLYLAHAYAVTGRLAEARRELEGAKTMARSLRQLRPDNSPDLDPRIMAGILGSLGEYEEAIKELRNTVRYTAWTRRGLAREPKLRSLRGNPAYEAFLREPDQ